MDEAPLSYSIPMAAGILTTTVLLFSAYAVRTLIVGRRHDARVHRLGGTPLFGAWLMEAAVWFMRAPGKFLARRRVKPDTLTWTSVLVSAVSMPVAASGHFCTAGLLVLVGAVFDALDGMVARETGTSSRSGAVLDSVLDRYADAAPMVGLVMFYRFSNWQMLVPLGALVGAQLVSYVRAKSESMGLHLPSTLMRRHERIAYVAAALIIAPLLSPFLGTPGGAVHPGTLAVIGMVAVISNVVAFRLLFAARLELNK